MKSNEQGRRLYIEGGVTMKCCEELMEAIRLDLADFYGLEVTW